MKTQSLVAEQYYEEKYDCDIEIEGRQYMEGNIINGPAYNTDTMIFFTSEKTLIVYEIEDNLLLDNRQAEEILNAIQNELIPDILSQIGYEYYWDNKNGAYRLICPPNLPIHLHILFCVLLRN